MDNSKLKGSNDSESSRDEHLIGAFTELAPKYEEVMDSELSKFWGWSYSGFISKLIELTPIGENDVVLDVATGTAVIPLKLTEQGRKAGQIVGLDITFDMLMHGSEKVNRKEPLGNINLTCADAMLMPFDQNSFDVVISGLATHHMNVPRMLNQMQRVLKRSGILVLADVGGSSFWRFPGIRIIIRLATFFYFLATENIDRAWTEASAVPNVRTAEEWNSLLAEQGFKNIQIERLSTSNAWIPSPLVIKARK
jgi:ubiquinone/menaquinone biosynthesis C-methylase UbiE